MASTLNEIFNRVVDYYYGINNEFALLIMAYSILSLTLTIWQAKLYFREGREEQRVPKRIVEKLFVCFLCAYQLVHHFAATLVSECLFNGGLSNRSPPPYSSAMMILLLSFVFIHPIAIIAVHSLRSSRKELPESWMDQLYTGALYAVQSYAAYRSTICLYESVQDNLPISQIFTSVAKFDIWICMGYLAIADQLDGLTTRPVLRNDRSLRIVTRLCWLIFWAREAWFCYLCFALPSSNWLSTSSRFFTSLTITEVSGGILPAIIIFMLRKYAQAQASAEEHVGADDADDQDDQVSKSDKLDIGKEDDIEANFLEQLKLDIAFVMV